MSIYLKHPSQIGAADIQELLQNRDVENARLEFKSAVPDKDETLKKLSSFANTFGGYMVVGARATSTDGRIEGLPGVDLQPGYKQTVVQWCFAGASPPLTVEVSDPIPVPAGNGKVCYVIRTTESDVAPHFLNGRKGVWVRTDEFSSKFEARLAEENELRHLLDRRRLVLERRASLFERARDRFNTYDARTHTDRGGHITKLGSRLELCVVPRFPTRPICEQEKLSHLIVGNNLAWHGGDFPGSSNRIVSQHESAILLQPAGESSILEANVWGMLFYARLIDGNHNGTHGIHLYEFVGSVLVFIRHAGKMLRAFGYSGPICIETALASILGVPWLHAPHGGLEIMLGSELDDKLAFSIVTTSEAVLENPDRVATDILRLVLFSVNSPGLVNTTENLELLVRKGYLYNRWPGPG